MQESFVSRSREGRTNKTKTWRDAEENRKHITVVSLRRKKKSLAVLVHVYSNLVRQKTSKPSPSLLRSYMAFTSASCSCLMYENIRHRHLTPNTFFKQVTPRRSCVASFLLTLKNGSFLIAPCWVWMPKVLSPWAHHPPVYSFYPICIPIFFLLAKSAISLRSLSLSLSLSTFLSLYIHSLLLLCHSLFIDVYVHYMVVRHGRATLQLRA